MALRGVPLIGHTNKLKYPVSTAKSPWDVFLLKNDSLVELVGHQGFLALLVVNQTC